MLLSVLPLLPIAGKVCHPFWLMVKYKSTDVYVAADDFLTKSAAISFLAMHTTMCHVCSHVSELKSELFRNLVQYGAILYAAYVTAQVSCYV